ncbi:hypothetical protein GMORB2_6952 [Geosmithia morbida]|uniref:Uncharacterized protein n=1 Tax=Geosmithia morbida TaxID=1094350 RepID=A0A9P5D4B7_9HYPO|nr:uncharacterized protein GMORB2_6952 [Geosmithia morbida]KAF4122645.1 hypothetical protein GMORB2_6952 [Geosmithia morbida]
MFNLFAFQVHNALVVFVLVSTYDCGHEEREFVRCVYHGRVAAFFRAVVHDKVCRRSTAAIRHRLCVECEAERRHGCRRRRRDGRSSTNTDAGHPRGHGDRERRRHHRLDRPSTSDGTMPTSTGTDERQARQQHRARQGHDPTDVPRPVRERSGIHAQRVRRMEQQPKLHTSSEEASGSRRPGTGGPAKKGRRDDGYVVVESESGSSRRSARGRSASDAGPKSSFIPSGDSFGAEAEFAHAGYHQGPSDPFLADSDLADDERSVVSSVQWPFHGKSAGGRGVDRADSQKTSTTSSSEGKRIRKQKAAFRRGDDVHQAVGRQWAAGNVTVHSSGSSGAKTYGEVPAYQGFTTGCSGTVPEYYPPRPPSSVYAGVPEPAPSAPHPGGAQGRGPAVPRELGDGAIVSGAAFNPAGMPSIAPEPSLLNPRCAPPPPPIGLRGFREPDDRRGIHLRQPTSSRNTSFPHQVNPEIINSSWGRNQGCPSQRKRSNASQAGSMGEGSGMMKRMGKSLLEKLRIRDGEDEDLEPEQTEVSFMCVGAKQQEGRF